MIEMNANFFEECDKHYKAGEQDGYERGYKNGQDKGFSDGEFIGKNKAFDKVIDYLNEWKDTQGVFISVNSLIKRCEEFRGEEQ